MAPVEKEKEKSRCPRGTLDQGVDAKAPVASAKPSALRKAWTALGLDLPTGLMMFKGGLPPAIALSLLQINAISNYFTTIGYLIAIIATIGMSIMPRAKFMQNMILHLVFLSTGTGVVMLIMYCSTQARLHTAAPTDAPTAYNASANAVAAVWLFFVVYFVNTLRARLPQLQLPVILVSIFTIVSCTFAASMPTMTYAIAFVEKLLVAFLTGLAIASAVHFLVFPITVRTIVFKQTTGYLGLLQKVLRANQAYITSLEDPTTLSNCMISSPDEGWKPTTETLAVRAMVKAVTDLQAAVVGNLPFAKREIAVGKMGPEVIGMIGKHLRAIMLPTITISSLIDFHERIASFHGWTSNGLKGGLNDEELAERARMMIEWSENFKSLHAPFDQIITVGVEGLEHILLRLELKKPTKAEKGIAAEDVEATAECTKPGDKRFAEYMASKIKDFDLGKEAMLQDWSMRHGIALSPGFFEHPQSAMYFDTESAPYQTKQQRQLYILLYMEFLLHSTAAAILSLVKYSDEVSELGVVSTTKLILPGWRRIKKWGASALSDSDSSGEDSQMLGDLNRPTATVDLGSAFNPRKDPEHLPPRNVGEKLGDWIRYIPHFFKSDASAFGFRVAVATMSIGLADFLHSSHAWFQYHRALWAMIMIAISMTPTAGQSIFSFVLRILGTIAAMILAFCAWYIPNQHTAGVIVFLWFFTALGMYIPLKHPPLAIVGVISVVTMVLILGYELTARKLGPEVVASNGQEFLPIYELGPWRIATVVVGLSVAFVFTVFPYPMTEHSLLRLNIGGSLYLLANYYSVVHETIVARVHDAEGDLKDKSSLGARLTKFRSKVFTKQLLMLTSMRTYTGFLKYEIPLGGRFPKKHYALMIQSIESLTRYMALLSYSSETLIEDDMPEHHLSQWSRDLKQVTRRISHTSHDITSLLALLSASIINGQPLPPYLRVPEPFQLPQKLMEIDPDILSVRHINEPEFATFAVFQIATQCILYELNALLRTAKELVGELDFSFHVVSTARSSQTTINNADSSSNFTDNYKKKED